MSKLVCSWLCNKKNKRNDSVCAKKVMKKWRSRDERSGEWSECQKMCNEASRVILKEK